MLDGTLVVLWADLKMIGNPLEIADRLGMAMFDTGHGTEANVRCLKEAFIFEARLEEDEEISSRLSFRHSLLQWTNLYLDDRREDSSVVLRILWCPTWRSARWHSHRQWHEDQSVRIQSIECRQGLPDRAETIRDPWLFSRGRRAATLGWMGSTKDQMRMRDGEVVIRLRLSVRSSNPCPAAKATAMIPGMFRRVIWFSFECSKNTS